VDVAKDIQAKVKDVIASTSDIVPKAASLKEENEAFYKKHQSSFVHVVGYLRSRQILDSSTKAQNEKQLIGAVHGSKFPLEAALASLATLKEWGSSEAVVEEFKAAVRKEWPEATSFAGH
jgi:hypothetical protein